MYIWYDMDANTLRTILDDLLVTNISQDKAWKQFYNILWSMVRNERVNQYDMGYREGYSAGCSDGYSRGHRDGLDEGFEEGAKTANG